MEAPSPCENSGNVTGHRHVRGAGPLIALHSGCHRETSRWLYITTFHVYLGRSVVSTGSKVTGRHKGTVVSGLTAPTCASFTDTSYPVQFHCFYYRRNAEKWHYPQWGKTNLIRIGSKCVFLDEYFQEWLQNSFPFWPKCIILLVIC